jgi:hypothetical protein
MKDKRRGTDYVHDLLASAGAHPDLVAAGAALGLHRTGPGPTPGGGRRR